MSNINEKLREIFINPKIRLIKCTDFINAGLSKIDYFTYIQLCEGVRSACVLKNNFQHNYYLSEKFWIREQKREKYDIKIIEDQWKLLCEWLWSKIGESYMPKFNVVYCISEPCAIWYHGIVTYYNLRHIEKVYKTLDDFRAEEIECYLSMIIRGQSFNYEKVQIKPEVQKSKYLNKNSKRKNCEFFVSSRCLLLNELCDKKECYYYLKGPQLPIRKIPTKGNQVDFSDKVILYNNNQKKDIMLHIKPYGEQNSFSMLEKAIVHRYIGDTVSQNGVTHTIKHIEKAISDNKTNINKKPVSLLSEYEKAMEKLNCLNEELDSIPKPYEPIDVDSAEYIVWVKEMVKYLYEIDDIYEKIGELEDLLDIN